MFIGVDRLQELALSIRTTAGGVISLGVIASLSTVEVPTAVNELSVKRPDVRITLSVRSTPAIVDAVQMRQFALGVVGRKPPYQGVEMLFQTTFPYVCLMPEDHPLVGGDGRLDLENLVDRETFVTLDGAYPDDMLEIEPTLSAKLRQRSKLSAANMPAVAALARESGNLAIVAPFSGGMAALQGGVVSRPLRQKLTYHVAVVTSGLDTLSIEAHELADLFVARLRRAQQQVGGNFGS